MKKLLFTFLLTVTINFGQSQTYNAFPTDSASWAVDYMAMGFLGSTIHVPRLYYIDGDTTIGTTNYSKMCFVYDSLPYAQSSCNSPLALLRDSNKTIYCRYFMGLTSAEFVLYDFNLIVGDTFEITGGMGIDQFVVNTIDSELTSTGYRKAWNLQKVSGWSTSLYNPRWVEGIGDIQNGVLYVEVPWVDWWCQGWCYKEWQTLIWFWTNGPCFNTAINEYSSENLFSLINDPAQQTIALKFQSNALRKVELIDITGKLLLGESTSEVTFKINTNEFAKGIYFVSVSDQGHSTTQKLIVF